MRQLRHGTRVVADTLLGYVLVGAGLVMLVTPGPGIVAIAAGLAVLARHYRWADRVKATVVAGIKDAGTRLRARRAGDRASGRLADQDPDPSGHAAGDRDAA